MDTPKESSLPAVEKILEVPRLQRGALNLLDIATSTMANIAPAMSFYFSSAFIAGAAGIGSPLTILLAAIAIALLGNTLAEFSRSIPSTGSFITFIGKTFGPLMAVTTTIVVSLGYIIAIASVIDISGGWAQITCKYLERTGGSGTWLPDRYLPVHRLGKLCIPCRGNHRAAAQRSQGYLFQHLADGSLIPAVYVRYRRGL